MKKPYYVIVDTESVVADDEHGHYLRSERYSPRPDQRDSGRRRGQRGRNDPLAHPRWMFQEIRVATVMVCASSDDGNIVPTEIVTFSAPEVDELAILSGVFGVINRLPADSTELVTYGGCWADVPLFVSQAMKYGLTLPRAWRAWMPWGGQGKAPHIDLMRVLTGSSKMKAAHVAEFAAVVGVPAKMSAAPWRAAEFMRKGEWQRVAEMCESDTITTALLFAAWRCLFEERSSLPVVHERIYRVVEELCPGRSYIREIKERRRQLFEQQTADARRQLEESLAA